MMRVAVRRTALELTICIRNIGAEDDMIKEACVGRCFVTPQLDGDYVKHFGEERAP
jgi:hypothetical protein